MSKRLVIKIRFGEDADPVRVHECRRSYREMRRITEPGYARVYALGVWRGLVALDTDGDGS